MIDENRILETFLEYVQIDSETLNEHNMAERLLLDLRELELETWTDDAGAKIGSNARNVYARLAGDPALEPRLFSAHMDTVKPGNSIKPFVSDGVITSGGDTILAADDKSGICGIVEALRTIIKEGIPHPTIETLFSISEEGGLNGAKNADYRTLSAKKAFVLDSGGNVGTIITSAPGQTKIFATVTGKSAHAGGAPETGISAIQAAASGIAAMKLLRIDDETTANIGTFKSEFATNIVPATAVIVAEARSRSEEKLERQTAHMIECLEAACRRYGATLECKTETSYLGYSHRQDSQIVKEATRACESLGLEPLYRASGGGSDANVMNHNGLTALVLGTGMEKGHTTSESITVKNLIDTARLCLALMTGN
ncbi:MAG: M20/M25/M40 family metallo-hydrolase [Synergistaceae bacterium]|jgi:tripeptide aminopeptidase|nr:M20/M25/M40 family metallo-hydrolase [Synergistaceae bacterium]